MTQTSQQQNEQSWLAALALEKFSPLLIEFDGGKSITGLQGDAEKYGYAKPALGADVFDYFDFLVGLEDQEHYEFAFVETPSGHSVHVLLRQSSERGILVLTDASLERDQRQALQQKSNELKLLSDEQARLLDELHALNKELDSKKQEAEKLSQLQGQFLASMSHEFRTPLASIITYAEYLTSENAKIKPQDGLTAIDRSAKHLLNLVENLIGHAQFTLEGIEINPEAVATRELCNEFEALFSPLAAEKKLRLSVSCDSQVPAYLDLDVMRIRQMVINLLGNACKYTAEGTVSLKIAWRDGLLNIEVGDTGKGIASDMLDRIFAPFERAGAQDSQGAGLGLHITQRLAKLMGGSVTVHSELNQGTTVLMSIPAVISASDNAAELPITGQRVLIIEDDSDVYDILEIYLDDAGHSVFHADSGVSALEMFDHIAPDTVITDLNVPDLNGIALIERLRANGFTGNIVVLTASSLKSDRVNAERAGCTAYLVKPVGPSELVAHLTQLVSQEAKP